MNKKNSTCPFHAGKEYQPFSKEQLDNPYPFFQRARDEQPIFYSPLLNAYVITRYEDVLNILKNPTEFSSAKSLQAVGDLTPEVVEVLRQGFPFVSLINSDGEQHKRLRTPFVKVFAPERLVTVEKSIYAIANKLVDNFIDNGRVEIISQFAHPLPLEVILTMYGVPLEKMEQVKQSGNSTSALFSSPLPPERQIECAKSYVALQQYLASLIEQRRSTPGDDLISELQSSDLTLPEQVLLLCEIVIAGHKTTASLIGTAIKLLVENSDIWQSLHENPALIPIALEEVLRYDTPAQSMVRVTTQEVTLSGVTIPQDSRVLLLYGSANRDSEEFIDGDRFDVERFQNNPVNHLAFSHGKHHCTGFNLARREARIALEVLSQRLPTLRITPNQELNHIPTLLDRGYVSLNLEGF
ncbi:MAG: cytochrome P450 [Richelia sp. RM2_1_2]|nr:cytochrome P450 [Richelia sp. SM1_7_0]NJN07136.1 cytochrome P450 [Richelia sp. RM1_1_1]NJO26154.1 cytochrome P450 [Richelia sp. SL_2_1]NJO57827.1 cytochrome P450 [Richelia sp. RM2_1_2]